MAYTICDQYGDCKPIRLLLTDSRDVPKLGEPFTPHWWVCDPCNGQQNRYEVYHQGRDATPTGYNWYQVVTSDDTPEDVAFKLAHYAKVIEARKALEEARREYERLNGGR